MIKRYSNKELTETWSDQTKLDLWQKVELAVIEARVKLGRLSKDIYVQIKSVLTSKPIDLVWWEKRDKEIHHDLNAFLEERLQHLPIELQGHLHQEMTSYDTEEAPFALRIGKSLELVTKALDTLIEVVEEKALRYQHTVMFGKTHGQGAELQTFGKRCLSWRLELLIALRAVEESVSSCVCSKLSGAVGNYTGVDPTLEQEALEILELLPLLGATQIVPRGKYTEAAYALTLAVATIGKIANDIRLGARSPRPIYQEPFGKKQKGSSAMPHKKNTINCEKIEGMVRMAKGYLVMIMDNIQTWEERDIAQSSVERVAWPDLFHVTVHAIETLSKVITGLQVYPDSMLEEIHSSKGCYASNGAKEFLIEHGGKFGLEREDAWRIVQLAAFIVHMPNDWRIKIRETPVDTFDWADKEVLNVEKSGLYSEINMSMKHVIDCGILFQLNELEATKEEIQRWNNILKRIFLMENIKKEWDQVFLPSHILRNEGVLFEKILGK